MTLFTPNPMIKYTTPFLAKLEDMIAESNYVLRYEKGQFKSGYCVLRDQNIIIINKFYSVEGKINALLDILRNVELDTTRFSEKNKNLYDELVAADTSVINNLTLCRSPSLVPELHRGCLSLVVIVRPAPPWTFGTSGCARPFTSRMEQRVMSSIPDRIFVSRCCVSV
ncbi:MAG: hypothetical protein ACKO3B_09970 [Bacteroidota bacterium]